jgi:hypothetical protein
MEESVRKRKWLLLAGLVIMLMAVGCNKTGDMVDVAGTAANPQVLPIYAAEYGQTPVPDPTRLIGHVYVWDDMTNLYVKYAMDVPQADGSQFVLWECLFDVRTDSVAFPYTGGSEPEVNPGGFLFQSNGSAQYLTEYTFTIQDYGAWLTGSTAAACAYCIAIQIPAGSTGGPLYFGYARDLNHPFKYGHGWWFPYTFEVPHCGEWHMNTAWGGKLYPDWKDWQFPGKNWALYIRYNLNATEYVGSLYAGNPKNGAADKVVGTVTVSDDVVAGVGNIYVKYTITKEDRALFSGHTIVRGSLDSIPQAKGNPIPGQFDYHWGPFDPPEDEWTVTIPYNPAWGTDLYIGAHAEVGWYY